MATATKTTSKKTSSTASKATAAKKPRARRKPKEDFSDYLTTDWPLYRPTELVKVGEYKDDPDSVIIKSQDGKMKRISREELDANYEPVKGLHKQQDF